MGKLFLVKFLIDFLLALQERQKKFQGNGLVALTINF